MLVALAVGWGPAWRHWLLVQRSISQLGELAYYLMFGTAATFPEQTVQVVGMRWAIAEWSESAKGEVGLDQ